MTANAGQRGPMKANTGQRRLVHTTMKVHTERMEAWMTWHVFWAQVSFLLLLLFVLLTISILCTRFMTHEGHWRMTHAHESRRRPNMANKGPQKPTQAHKGSRQPMQVNKGPWKAMQADEKSTRAYESPCRKDGPRYVFFHFFHSFYQQYLYYVVFGLWVMKANGWRHRPKKANKGPRSQRQRKPTIRPRRLTTANTAMHARKSHWQQKPTQASQANADHRTTTSPSFLFMDTCFN